MKRSLKKYKGLPGGPNEKFSFEGYRKNSPDVNNPFNVILSNNITMKEKDGSPLKKGPLLGTDNLGNSKIMMPGADYTFPGNMVVETPLAKKGGQFQNSNITATNKLFAVNKLYKKRKKGKRARGIYNPKAKYTYDDGGQLGCPIGYEWNGIECVPNPFETRPSQRAAVYMDKDGNYKIDPVYQQYSQQKFDVSESNRKAQEFNKLYAQSKNYKRLLKKQGYTPEEIKDRINSVMNINDFRYIDQGPSWVGADENTGKEFISYNVTDPGDWPGFDQIAAHEWGHVGVDSGANPLKPKEREEFINRINKEQAGITGVESDLQHDMEPQENRADLVQLRQQLQEAGVFDSTKRKKFTKKDLKKYKEIMQSSEKNWDNMWNRMFRLYDDDSIIHFMNNIAKNNSDQDVQVAKYGMELDLTEDEIQKYVKGGYVVEDISVPSLTRMDNGGEKRKRRKNKTQQTEEITSIEQPIAPDDIQMVIEKPEVEVNPAPERVPLMMKFSNEFQENNPYDAYYEKAAYDYLKKQKGWNEALGINKSNLPENVAKRIQNNYYKDLQDYVINQSKDIQKQYIGKFDKKGNWISSSGNKNILNPLEKKPTGNGPWNNWGDSGVQMVYPEKLFIGPGAGLLGLAGRGAAKGIANLAKTSLVQGTKAVLTQPIRNIPGLTVGNAIASGFAADALVNRLPEIPKQLAEGEYLDAGINAATGILDLAGANMASPLIENVVKGTAALTKPIVNYGTDVINTSKEAGKFSLPKYRNVYRAEHADFNTLANNNSLTGRWFEDNPGDVTFYIKKLKDPNTGEVIMNSDASVRILKKRLPEYKIKQNFGAGMPEEARTMSMGRGNLTNTELDQVLGPGAGRRFTTGSFTSGDINSMATAPFLYRPSEGILDPTLVNELRKNSKLFEGKQNAMDYLFKEHNKIKNAKRFQSYLPFNKQGGIVSDLTEDEIADYIKRGYIVEEIFTSPLDKMGNGGEKRRRGKENKEKESETISSDEKIPESTYTPIDPNWLAQNPDVYSQIVNKPEVSTERQGSDIGKLRAEYRDKNPMDLFLDEKKRQYLKKNKGLNKAAGVTMENFPEDVLQNFMNEYDYKTNNYAVNKLGKKEGWNPRRRGEWVDELTPGEKDAVAESKYGSKLQPSYWAKSLAGLATLVSPFSPEIQNIMNEGHMPGLTKKESKEILNSKMTKVPFTNMDLPFSIPLGGLNTIAPIDIPGAAIANYVKNTGLSTGSDYKDQANALAGEKMANVSEMEAMAFNPLTYAGLEAIPELGVNLVKGIGRGITMAPEAISNLGKIIRKETPAFKSEINWRDWVKYKEDFDNNPNVIQELNDIEKSSKEAGTWMKNPDGTPFQGTPEQFVVQQSTNWKNAFPEYYGETLTTRSNNQFDTFDQSKFGATDDGWHGEGIYTYPTEDVKEGLGLLYGPNEYELYVNSANKGVAEGPYLKGSYVYQKDTNKLMKDFYDKYRKIKESGKWDDAVQRRFDTEYEDLNKYINAAKENNINDYTTLRVPSSDNEVIIPFNNTVKSAKGNILFDMTNPNIYKAMLPYIIPAGLGVGAASQMQGQESNASFKDGGIVSELSQKEIDKLIKQGYIIEEID
jgi:hypothetical protein